MGDFARGGAPRDRARLAVVHRSHQLGHACDSPLGLARDIRSGENWCTGCRENDLPQRAVASPRLPDFDRADRIGEFWSYPESRAFAELLIDCEEDPSFVASFYGGRQYRAFRFRGV